jgi:hypothetical protein
MIRTTAAFVLALATAAHSAPPAKPFERLDGCQLIPNRWNGGDTFHVRTADGREIVARLYFIDAPESETAWRDRLAEQAQYFGITTENAAAVAREAAAFTSKRLADPFTVWTRWRDALGPFCAWARVRNRHRERTRLERAACGERAGAHLRHAHAAFRWQGFAEISLTARRTGGDGKARAQRRMEVHEMTYAEIHAKALARAGWSYGFTSYLQRDGCKTVVADAHRNGVRLIAHAECLETALLELWTDAQRVAAASVPRPLAGRQGYEILMGAFPFCGSARGVFLRFQVLDLRLLRFGCRLRFHWQKVFFLLFAGFLALDADCLTAVCQCWKPTTRAQHPPARDVDRYVRSPVNWKDRISRNGIA